MQAKPPARRQSAREAATFGLLLLILILAAAIRFYALGAQSLWSDEGNSATMATRSLVQIAQATASDIHPPLYYWLLHLWTGVAGTSEAGLRSLSAILGVLLVLATAELGRRFHNVTTGLAAAFIAAIAPFQVYYGQEARMYMLLALEAAVAVLLFERLVSQEDRRLGRDGQAPAGKTSVPWITAAALFVVFAAGLYTHYAFPLVMAFLTPLYLAWLWSSRRRGQVWLRLFRWLLTVFLSVVLFGPWLSTAVHQLRSWPAADSGASLLTVIEVSLTSLGLGPTGLLQPNLWWLLALALIALIGLIGDLIWLRKSPARPGTPAWLLWLTPLVWAIAPLGLMLLPGLFRDAYLKFLLLASPAFVLLLTRGALTFVRPPENHVEGQNGAAAAPAKLSYGFALGVLWALSVLTLMTSLYAATLSRYFSDPQAARDDYRGIAEFIVATAHPNDAILLIAPGQAEVFQYYYDGNLPVYPMPRKRPIDPQATTKELTDLLKYDKVYAVYWANREADPQNLVQSWMDNHGYKTIDEWRGNVRTAVYVMPEHRAPDEAVDTPGSLLGPDIELGGYKSWSLSPAAGEVTQLQLLWHALRKPTHRYKVFLQLLDSRDQVIAQRDSEPVGDSRPTDTWDSGESIVDNHGLLIPPGTPPGRYRRIAGMYDRDTGERLLLPNGADHLDLSPVTVARAGSPPPLAALAMQYGQSFDFGGITLLGHDRYKRGFGHAPGTPIYPGDRLHLTFYWQANVQPRADWWFNLTLSDSNGHAVATLESPLVAETYATTLWNKGEIVRGEHDLQIPADLGPGNYRLSLNMLPDVETQAGTAYLGTVRVAHSPSER